MYKVVIFDKKGRDVHHVIAAEKLDDFILSAIWAANFDHLMIFDQRKL